MKLDIDLPWGGKLHFERQPMSDGTRGLIAAIIGALFFLSLIYMTR